MIVTTAEKRAMTGEIDAKTAAKGHGEIGATRSVAKTDGK